MLHIIQSALSRDAVKRLLTQVHTDDAIVLMNDAVYLASQVVHCSSPCYHMLSDSQIRAANVPNTILPIDMGGLVDLTEQHPCSASW